jgi:hypothetical protein
MMRREHDYDEDVYQTKILAGGTHLRCQKTWSLVGRRKRWESWGGGPFSTRSRDVLCCWVIFLKQVIQIVGLLCVMEKEGVQ